jgi:uncharacterized protein (TIGR02145 family)
MAFWEGEIKELDKLYESFKGHLPDIVKELEQLIRTEDPNVVMLYSRRCLEVIVTDLCESELQRPRKTEPLKGILDKLNSEEKVPAHIITSMQSLNSMATYGAHPKDFDPEQVKPVLNNLAIIIKWYLKYKDFKIVSKVGPEEKEYKIIDQINKNEQPVTKTDKPEPKKRKLLARIGIIFGIAVVLFILISILRVVILFFSAKNSEAASDMYYINPGIAFTDLRDNQIYTEVKIGNQVWMGENLLADLYNDGTHIPIVKSTSKWISIETPAYCWYDNKERVYGQIYGALYNWYAVNTGKLCPTGWHVPTEAEWDTLALFLDPEADSLDFFWQISREAGIKMKEAGASHWEITDGVYGTNESGFTALPGGFRSGEGFFYLGKITIWWSSSGSPNPNDTLYAESKVIDERVKSFFQSDYERKNCGFSVRCIKNQN